MRLTSRLFRRLPHGQEPPHESITRTKLYKRHRFPAAIIGHDVWRYFRPSSSYRNVEALLAARGVMLTDEPYAIDSDFSDA